MSHAVSKQPASFREPFVYINSPAAIARFPYPFDRDAYMYAVNIEPHLPGPKGSAYEHKLDVDEHYLAEIVERRLVLERDPYRYGALPHMQLHQWDTLELVMESFAASYPEKFSLERRGDRWTWINRPLGLVDRFVFGDAASLPRAPLDYILRQAQGDFVVMDQRDGDLYADAGMVTGPADWTLNFDLGMSFKEWHGPVPMAHEIGVFDRALGFLLKLQAGHPVRRLNWTMTVNPRLDTSPETYPAWGPDRTTITTETIGQLLHLRVELQSLYRLPRSNGVLFSIRTFMLGFDDLVTNPLWAKRTHRILKNLPAALVDYKGLARYRDIAIAWLARFDDGS
jgi:dimethylamine monooxygenase subunit A